ncbi:MAG: right-handed parallel beta-helix repeat-containing protein [Nitrospinota bacterium]
MKKKTICPNCFEQKGDEPLCRGCGFDETKRGGSLFLPYRTILNEQYILGKELGKPGGFGIVYLAKHLLLENLVAIKEFIPSSIAGRGTDGISIALHSQDYEENFTNGLRKFLEEGRILEQLDHQNVVRVKTLFKANGTGYLVMNYLQGVSLSEHVKGNGGKISERETLTLLKLILDGLEEVHKKKLLHRDIKPQNIYVTENKRPILLDFGAARDALENDLSVILTPGFAPFEQYDRKGVQGPWTDIYATAATAYYMVTGKRPQDAVERNVKDELVSPDKLTPGLSPIFCNALMKALEKEPSSRPQNISEFRDMLTGKNPAAAPVGTAGGPVSQADMNPDAVDTPTTSHSGPTLTVSKLGEADHRSINEAVEAAKPGTRIYISPGFYSEDVVISKPVEIVGAGPVKDITVEGLPCILMDTDYSKVRGLTLLGRSGPEDKAYSAVEIPKGRLVLENCDITSNSIGCVSVHGAKTTPIIKRCKIRDGKHVGIWVTDGGDATIEECDIQRNELAGIAIRSGGNPKIRRCVLRNGKKGGLWIHDDGEGIIEDCDIHNNALGGIAITKGASPTIRRCKVRGGRRSGIFIYDNGMGLLEECNIYGNALEGIEIKTGGDPVIKNCKIHDSKNSGVMVYEKGRGTIEGCEIFKNGGANVDIKDGGNPIVKNCKIHNGKQIGIWAHTGGTGIIEKCDVYENGLTGVAITKGGKPIIRKCKIRNGRQIGVVIWKGSGLVEECDISANAKSNVEFTQGSRASVKKCRIYDGKEEGIIFQENGEGIVEICDIFQNSLDGIRVREGADPIIEQCRIHDGKQSGIHFEKKAAGMVKECEIFSNAQNGVEISDDAAPSVTSCRINKNSFAGIKVHKKGIGTVENCDLAGNGKGAFDAGFFAKIERKNNREK